MYIYIYIHIHIYTYTTNNDDNNNDNKDDTNDNNTISSSGDWGDGVLRPSAPMRLMVTIGFVPFRNMYQWFPPGYYVSVIV